MNANCTEGDKVKTTIISVSNQLFVCVFLFCSFFHYTPSPLNPPLPLPPSIPPPPKKNPLTPTHAFVDNCCYVSTVKHLHFPFYIIYMVGYTSEIGSSGVGNECCIRLLQDRVLDITNMCNLAQYNHICQWHLLFYRTHLDNC